MIMREIRDSADHERNPHDLGCSSRPACSCSRSKRMIAAWAAFHEALAADEPEDGSR
jgi:hypothetical protein